MTHTSPEPPVREKLPPHVLKVRNRVGREYYYLSLHRGTERQAPRIRLPDDPRSPEFWAAYASLMKLPPPKDNPNSVRNLDKAWGASPEWAELSDNTKKDWVRYRARIVEAWGELEVRGIEPKHVLHLRNKWADQAASANNLLKCLNSMMAWGVPNGYRDDNPCREVRQLKGGEGYLPWPLAVVHAARRQLTLEKREDLWWATAVALYTGQRLADCLDMKWSAIGRDGVIFVKQGKTGRELFIPIHRELRAVLETIPRRSTHILTSTEGKPWQSGFQASWQKNKPALASRLGLVFHGLRKSAVVMLLEAGCTEAETASITGQTLAMVAHYGKQVNQRRLAAKAILKWERHDRQ